VGQIGLSKAAAAPRHDASSFRGGSARATSRASFGRQTEAFEVLSLLRRSRSNPFLGGHSDGADRASKKATECQLLFFGASVSTFDFRLPSGTTKKSQKKRTSRFSLFLQHSSNSAGLVTVPSEFLERGMKKSFFSAALRCCMRSIYDLA